MPAKKKDPEYTYEELRNLIGETNSAYEAAKRDNELLLKILETSEISFDGQMYLVDTYQMRLKYLSDDLVKYNALMDKLTEPKRAFRDAVLSVMGRLEAKKAAASEEE